MMHMYNVGFLAQTPAAAFEETPVDFLLKSLGKFWLIIPRRQAL